MNTIAITFLACLPLAAAPDDRPPFVEENFAVELQPGAAGSKLAPNYSPKGTQIALKAQAMPGLAGVDHLAGRIAIGPPHNRGEGTLVVLARSEAGKPYDMLFIDAAGDGAVTDDKPLTAKPSLQRGSTWSSFSGTLRVNHAEKDRPAAWEEYAVNYWAVVEKVAEQPAIVRFSRRGFLHGEVKLADATWSIVLSDSDNDAVFGKGDWWSLQPAGPEARAMHDKSRPIGDYGWAGGKAWKLELAGTNGRSGRLVSFDAGTTEEQDLVSRDKLRDDRLAPRAAKPVAFRSDVNEALKAAGEGRGPYFLKFETVWCGPCKQMTQYVFNAKDVAEAANGVACIVIDGDEYKELVEKHGVKGYPHGILFSADGQELARYSGYQSVKEMTAFFKKAKP